MSTVRGLLNLVRNAEKLGETLKLKRSDVELLNTHMIKKVKAHSPLTTSDMAVGKRLGKFNASLLHEIRLNYGKDGKFIGKKAASARKTSHSARLDEAKAKHAAARRASVAAKKQHSKQDLPNGGKEKRYNDDDFHNQKRKESPFKDEPKSKGKKKKKKPNKNLYEATRAMIKKTSRTNIAVGSAAGGVVAHSIFSGDSKD